jgi:hypothetical protein
MQIANVMLAIGGDLGNTVPKSNVTAAEIPVLMGIHGNEAVFDIEPMGSIARSNREELHRLKHLYEHFGPDGKDASPIATLYPGAAARVFDALDELGLDESLFKPTARAKTSVPATGPAFLDTEPDGVEAQRDHAAEVMAAADGLAGKAGMKRRAKAIEQPETSLSETVPATGGEDGIGDMAPAPGVFG